MMLYYQENIDVGLSLDFLVLVSGYSTGQSYPLFEQL